MKELEVCGGKKGEIRIMLVSKRKSKYGKLRKGVVFKSDIGVHVKTREKLFEDNTIVNRVKFL